VVAVLADDQTVAVLTLQLSAPAAAGFAAAAGAQSHLTDGVQTQLGAAAAAAASDAPAVPAVEAAAAAGSTGTDSAAADAPPQQQQQQQQPAECLQESQLSQQQEQQQLAQQQQQLLFQVVLPPPSAGHAEFVILRSRFEASLQHTWQPGDRVQVRITLIQHFSWMFVVAVCQ
jgi:hypothetical protein